MARAVLRAKHCMRASSVRSMTHWGGFCVRCQPWYVILLSSSSPTSICLDFLLFKPGKVGECLCLWDDVLLLGVEVYKACRAHWTDA